VVLQPDGKLVTAGTVLARFDAGGQLDPGFNGTGTVDNGISANDVALQADGKLVVAGSVGDDLAVARYHSDGSPDTGFDGDGRVVTDIAALPDFANAVVIQSDGKILIGGTARRVPAAGQAYHQTFLLVRYLPNGSLDSTFGTGGKVSSSIGAVSGCYDLVLQPDGRIVAAGFADSELVLVRYLADGTPDPSFHGDGIVTRPGFVAANGVVLQSDGKIVAGGYTSDTRFGALRYLPDGTPDAGFDGVTGVPGYANDVALQADGKVLLAGYVSAGAVPPPAFVVVRLMANGVLDPDFGEAGKVTTSFSTAAFGNGIAIRPGDGRIVVAGGGGGLLAMARYQAVNEEAEIAVEQPAGLPVPDGATKWLGEALLPGARSLTFTIRNAGLSDLTGLAVTLDGPDAGDFSVTAPPLPSAAAASTTSFTVTFTPSTLGIKTAALHIASNDSDENPYDINLTATAVDELTIANTPGSQDMSFQMPATLGEVSLNSLVYQSIAAYPDGRVVAVAEGTYTEGGVTRLATLLMRFLADGRFDPSFQGGAVIIPDLHLTMTERGVLIDPLGRVLLTGTINDDVAVMRFNANGTLDAGFGTGGTVTTNLTNGWRRQGGDVIPVPSQDSAAGLALQPDGKILLAGTAIHEADQHRPVSMAVVRYLPDGSPDSNFGSSGVVVRGISFGDHPGAGGGATAVVVLGNGKIVLGGWSDREGFAFLRLHAGGTTDSIFGGMHRIYPFAEREHLGAFAATPDGTIVATGSLPVIRIVGGVPAPSTEREFILESYGGNLNVRGPVGDQGASIALQPDGRMLVLTNNSLSRYHPDGSVDTGFLNSAGGSSVVLQSDGRILVAGAFGIRRYFGGTQWLTAEYPPGTLLADGSGSIDFGSVLPGGVSRRTLTIRNSGPAGVTGITIGKEGSDLGAFTVGDPGATSLAPGQSTTFEVAFSPAAAGASSVFLHISAGNIEEDAIDLNLFGRAPSIVVEHPAGHPLTDSDPVPADFGLLPSGGTRTLTFTLRNSAATTLTGLGAAMAAIGNSGDFSVAAPVSDSLEPGAATTLNVTFAPTASGVRSASVHITASGSPYPIFVLHVAGTQTTASAAWRHTWFGSADAAGPGADLNDADSDGVPNLVEFATLTNPLQATSPWTLYRNGEFIEFITTRYMAARSEVSLTAEWSESLAGIWNTVNEGSATVLGDDGTSEFILFRIPAGNFTTRFFRLRATRR